MLKHMAAMAANKQEYAMRKILPTFAAVAMLALVACADNSQAPTSGGIGGSTAATAVASPAIAFPTPEQLASASAIITRGEFKGNYLSDNHPIRLSISERNPQCLFMYDGWSSRPRNVENRSTRIPVSLAGRREVAIGFHKENRTCGLKHTDGGLVPYVFVEKAYRLRDWWVMVAKDSDDNLVHCWLSRRSYNPEHSWCQEQVS